MMPSHTTITLTSARDSDNSVELDVQRDSLWLGLTECDRQTIELDRAASAELASVLLHYAVHGTLPPKPTEANDGGY